MLFNSLAFCVFLPLSFAVYWWLCYPREGDVSHRRLWMQNLFIVLASYIFYGWWDWRFLLLITLTALWSWGSGLLLLRLEHQRMRKFVVVLALVVNLGILGVFKYCNFFVENAVVLLNLCGLRAHLVSLKIVLPVGISFYTFQALSYVIDVYRRDISPTRDVVAFLAFVSFFPQLVAGPIERATNLLPQFLRVRRFNADAATHGLCLLAYGLFKKMVVADTLSMYCDQVFRDPLFYSSVTCLIGAIFFSLQIYCDFSGYSDVARGVAKLFGFELMQNFNRPSLSRTFSEFWRRWHISLSSWFRDYVYIPLGGSRVSRAKLFRNLWIVFLLSGLWHGASWAFVIWGALHALYLSLGVIFGRRSAKQATGGWLSQSFSIVVVNAGVVFAWIFFRAGTLEQSAVYLRALLRCRFSTSLMLLCAGLGPMHFAFCLLSASLLLLSYLFPRDCTLKTMVGRLVFTLLCIAAIVFVGVPSGGEFIYFRF